MDYIVNNNVSILVHHLNKCTTQMKDVMEKLVVGGRMETLGYFAFSKPKTALKKKVYYHNDEYTYAAAAAKSLQSCLTLCDPIDSSPPGSPVPGIFQARTLEWVAISFSNA